MISSAGLSGHTACASIARSRARAYSIAANKAGVCGAGSRSRCRRERSASAAGRTIPITRGGGSPGSLAARAIASNGATPSGFATGTSRPPLYADVAVYFSNSATAQLARAIIAAGRASSFIPQCKADTLFTSMTPFERRPVYRTSGLAPGTRPCRPSTTVPLKKPRFNPASRTKRNERVCEPRFPSTCFSSLPVQGEGEGQGASTQSLTSTHSALEIASLTYRASANHSDSSGLARSLALSFSRVAAARRIPVLPHVLQRNSGFLARARHARGNDRKIRLNGRACHYLVQDSNRTLAGKLDTVMLIKLFHKGAGTSLF